jgi:hypothetical protein
VHHIEDVKGRIWLATDHGAYRVTAKRAEPILSGVVVWTVAEVQGNVWLGTDEGVFRVFGDQAHPLSPDVFSSSDVLAILEFDSWIWLGTSRGLFRMKLEPSSARDEHTPLFGDLVNSLTKLGNTLWVGTQSNAYRIEKPQGEDSIHKPIPLFTEPIAVSKVVEAGHNLWFLTRRILTIPGPVFRLDHESILPAFPGYKVASVAEDSTGEVWFGTTDGLFRLVGENLETVTLPRNSGAVNVVKNLEGELWVGTTQKAYRQSRTEFAPVAIDNGQINVTNSRSEINVKGFTKSGSEIWVWSTEGAYLFDDRAGPWKTGLGTTFLWWLLAWVVLLFAPWFKPAMRFVMSSLLRGYLSVGAIPIALLFDFTRRHLFRRYVSKIREAPEYPDTDLGISSRGLDFGKELTLESPKLLLVGKTADTERYLKYITGRLAQRKHGYRSLRKTIPVFINAATDVEGTERKDLEIAAARALLLGNFTDEDLAIKTFKEGGFVFLINGLLGDDYRAIEAFANQYANCGNFVVVATESAANQLKGFPEAVSWERTGKLLNL